MTYTFGVFRFDGASRELMREGRRVALEPQPARALALLLSRAGDVVTREEMRQAIWGAETHVDYDRGLAYCVGQVRSALGDSAEQPRFVQTLPKRGFRFLAPVAVDAPAVAPVASSLPAAGGQASVPGARSPRWSVAAAALVVAAVAAVGWRFAVPAPPPVVAVSIFDNETGDPGHDRFVTGLSDLVVTELANLAPGQIGVVGNAAALRQPRNIRNLQALAASVDADYVVLGQLQRQDDRLRFIVHFIRLSDGVHLQAQRFVRPADDVRAFEGDVLAETARVVRSHVLTPGAS